MEQAQAAQRERASSQSTEGGPGQRVRAESFVARAREAAERTQAAVEEAAERTQAAASKLQDAALEEKRGFDERRRLGRLQVIALRLPAVNSLSDPCCSSCMQARAMERPADEGGTLPPPALDGSGSGGGRVEACELDDGVDNSTALVYSSLQVHKDPCC